MSQLSTAVSPSRSSSAIARRDAAAASRRPQRPVRAREQGVVAVAAGSAGRPAPAETTSECLLRYSCATFTASWTVPLPSMAR